MHRFAATLSILAVAGLVEDLLSSPPETESFSQKIERLKSSRTISKAPQPPMPLLHPVAPEPPVVLRFQSTVTARSEVLAPATRRRPELRVPHHPQKGLRGSAVPVHPRQGLRQPERRQHRNTPTRRRPRVMVQPVIAALRETLVPTRKRAVNVRPKHAPGLKETGRIFLCNNFLQ